MSDETRAESDRLKAELEEHRRTHDLYMCGACGAVTDHPKVLRSNPKCFNCDAMGLRRLPGV